MVKVVSPLFSAEARGSVGELTYSTHRGTSTVRVRKGPAKQYSTRQIEVRNCTAQSTALWRTLTATVRDLWNQYATDHLCTDWTGSPKRLSGFNWFVRLNCVLLDSGNSPVTLPPPQCDVSIPVPLVVERDVDGWIAYALLDDNPLAFNCILDLWATYECSPGSKPTRRAAHHIGYAGFGETVFVPGSVPTRLVVVFARYIDSGTGQQHPWSSYSLLVPTSLGTYTVTFAPASNHSARLQGVAVVGHGHTFYSNSSGVASITGLQSGSYSFVASHQYFEDLALPNNVIVAGQVTDDGVVYMQDEEPP